jgi:hypothetical protein
MKGQRKMKIESLDVLKAQQQLDLQEQVRRDDIFNRLVSINEQITNLGVFPALGWVWCFDIIKDIFDNNHEDDIAEGDIIDEVVPSGTTLKEIFEAFYRDIDTLGLEMDHGGEIIEEVIRDWMNGNGFLMYIEEEDLDDEEDL